MDGSSPTEPTAYDRAAALADPLRLRLFEFVLDAGHPVSREEAAAALDIGRAPAAYHLDQLVAQGLLVTTFARLTGRSGPGAGRPAKLYQAADTEVSVQVPPRDDTLLAHLLATAIESEPTGRAREALRAAARGEGAALGREIAADGVDGLVHRLEQRGYAPVHRHEGIRLRNCPFHHLIDDHLELVCALNCDLLGTAVETAELELVAELDPQPAHCCVVLRPR